MATITFERIPAASRSVRPMRLTRRGERVVAFGAVVLTLVAFYLVSVLVSGAVQASRTDSSVPVATRTVTVAAGDTLWQIAVNAAPSADPRAVIDRIERLNALTPGATLQVGQTLVVPVIE